jgi:ComF family protein
MMAMRHWFDFLFPPREDEVVLRSVSIDDYLRLLSPRVISETRPETIVLLPFNRAVVRAAIHEAKYHGSERAFSLLGHALAEYLRDCDDVGHRMSHIRLLPVPLGKLRRKERGFNQSEEIAKRAAKELDLVVDAALLVRTRETASQVSLPRRAREKNMHRAFTAEHPIDPTHTYIVVDDVITTGATLQATVDALSEAGALHIIPIALAH